VIELSTGFISLPTDALLRLIEKVKAAGLKAKPELGIQFGAGGDLPGNWKAREPRIQAGSSRRRSAVSMPAPTSS
jgi:phosphosulfolactate synthase (CoM biosynthesis protein A)